MNEIGKTFAIIWSYSYFKVVDDGGGGGGDGADDGGCRSGKRCASHKKNWLDKIILFIP